MLRKIVSSQCMSYLFECRDAQIDFFIHLLVKRGPSRSLSPPPTIESTQAFYRHRPRCWDIVFDSPCYVLITGSSVYQHGLDTYRWIRARADTHTHTHTHTHSITRRNIKAHENMAYQRCKRSSSLPCFSERGVCVSNIRTSIPCIS